MLVDPMGLRHSFSFSKGLNQITLTHPSDQIRLPIMPRRAIEAGEHATSICVSIDADRRAQVADVARFLGRMAADDDFARPADGFDQRFPEQVIFFLFVQWNKTVLCTAPSFFGK